MYGLSGTHLLYNELEIYGVWKVALQKRGPTETLISQTRLLYKLLYIWITLNSAHNEIAFNEKPPITKQNLCIYFFVIGEVECI